ncbi:MAG: NAD-dependent epimerase/dehydratase family protein [Bacteroidia bacterium]|nr:NAD-dependent epimerase/dehydratase family protein [Bacteroidia bacterium]
MVFVTGGTGFVGSYLLAALVSRGRQVRALKRAGSTTAYCEGIFNYKFGAEGAALFSKINWVEGDLFDIYALENAMDGAGEIYHCAAIVSLRDENPGEIIRTSEKGTANMVNAALSKGIANFCFTSSVAALAEQEGSETTEEHFKDFTFGKAPYFTAKHLAEAQVWRGNAEGLNVVVVAPTIVLGPWNGKNKGSMELISTADKNSKFYTGGTMGYVHVADVAEVMIRLMDNKLYNERYILNSENVLYRDVISQIATNLGKQPPRFRLSRTALRLLRLLNNAVNKRKISRITIAHAAGDYRYSNRKIKQALGGFNFVPVKAALEEQVKFYLNEKGR